MELPKTEQEGHDHDVCPSCATELCAGHILDWGKKYKPENPEQYASAYGWPAKLCGSKTIGVEISGAYDGVCYWQCPACDERFHRFEPNSRIHALVEQHWSRADIENARAESQ